MRTEISIETKQWPSAHSKRRRRVVRRWCAACEATQHLLSAEYAAYLSGLGLPQLLSHIEGGQLHSVEALGGTLVCLESLCALTSRTRELTLSSARPEGLVNTK